MIKVYYWKQRREYGSFRSALTDIQWYLFPGVMMWRSAVDATREEFDSIVENVVWRPGV